MNSFPPRVARQRGSMILAAFFVITVMTMIIASSLSYSLSSFRNAKRLALLEQAKLKAEGEMEVLFYNWKIQVFKRTPVEDIPGALTTGSVTVDIADVENETVTPYGAIDGMGTWEVSRALRYGTTANGSLASDPSKTGQISDFTALTLATVTHPLLGTMTYRMGRRFEIINTTIFQFSVFYQNLMEFSAGSPMKIRGNISSNGGIFMTSLNPDELIIRDTVKYFTTFNGHATPLPAAGEVETYNFAGSTNGNTPIFDPNMTASSTASNAPTDQDAARLNQVKQLTEVENFLGGIDVDNALAMESGGTPVYESENDVYRSVISPPPTNGGSLVEEDAVIRANRMYYKAGLLIEVNSTTSSEFATKPVKLLIPTSIDPVTNVPTGFTDVTSTSYYADLVAAIETRKLVYDQREATNVRMTTVDLGVLNTMLKDLQTSRPTDPLLTSFKNSGVVYIHDPNSQVDSSADSDSTPDRNGIRVKNGEQTPYFTKPNGDPLGFTVATDNGLYVQGNYNTLPPDGVTGNNVAALMGDAVTVLSSNWDDANSEASVWNRVAASTTIRSAIVSGNTASAPASGTSPAARSGGVQNLVRLMENWTSDDPDAPITFTLEGSLGQLFVSKYYTEPFKGTGVVYNVPDQRNLNFDDQLAATPPKGTPVTSRFVRGTYFIWHKGDDTTTL